MVSIPVRLYSATEDRDVSFHQVHDEDAGRVRYQRMCTVCDKEVAYADLAKGFELPSGETVLLTDEDFANLPLPTTKVVELQDKSKITLKKLGHEYDPTNRSQAIDLLHKASQEQLFLTGLIYSGNAGKPMDEQLNLVAEPLATLPASRVRPPPEVLAKIMEQFK